MSNAANAQHQLGAADTHTSGPDTPLSHHFLVKNAVDLQAKAILNAVNALPQLEQADKLLTRLPQAKWAADMHSATSASRNYSQVLLVQPLRNILKSVHPSTMRRKAVSAACRVLGAQVL